MELLEYWKIIRKRLWLILTLMVLATIAAAWYTSQQVPLYSTTTTLFINPGQLPNMLPREFDDLMSRDRVESLANTYIQLIGTRSFVQRVVDELGQDVSEWDVSGALSANYVPNTQFFRMSATHPDPVMAQQIANTAAHVLITREEQRQQSEQEQRAVQGSTSSSLARQHLEN